MSRAFTPPDTLSKDEIRTLSDVRRYIWTQALTGLAAGTVAGYALHTVASIGNRRGFWKMPYLNRNTALLSVLLSGAMGSFVMATTAGQNEVHNLHPIFANNKNLAEESLEQAKQRNTDLRYLEKRQRGHHLNAEEQDVIDRVKREKNRLYRRASLTQSMEHPGISDSHGGHWVEDDNNKFENEEDEENK